MAHQPQRLAARFLLALGGEVGQLAHQVRPAVGDGIGGVVAVFLDGADLVAARAQPLGHLPQRRHRHRLGAERGEGVRIFIGSENKLFSLSGSSTIIAPYGDAQGRIVGVLGVIGPTRLNYARVIPTVDYAARIVSKMLGG